MNISTIENSILHGDCIVRLKEIPDNTINMIFADSPYYMQTDGALIRPEGSTFSGVDDHWDKFGGYNEYDLFSVGWLTECKRVLTKDGSIWVIGAFQNIYRLGFIMQNLGYWILNDVIWSKPNAVPNFAGTRFQNSHETMLWCTKNQKAKYTFNYKTMKRLNNGKQEKSVWDIGICSGEERLKDRNGKKVHSTQKPEKLLTQIILASTRPDDIVLDPFFGTGTTGAVAKKLGRKFIGIEREEYYIHYAEERIAEVQTEIDQYSDLSLEVKPPKVPMDKLLARGMLKSGQELFNKDETISVTIADNGHLCDEEGKLSIHKMAAKYLGKDNFNGWDYWYFKDGEVLSSINNLRNVYASGMLCMV